MKKQRHIYYFSSRLMYAASAVIILLVAGNHLPLVGILAQIALLSFIALVIIDLFILIKIPANGVVGQRDMAYRFSNGDPNRISFEITNNMQYIIDAVIVDELPHQFQIRNFKYKYHLYKGATKTESYELRPVERGEYNFGKLLAFISTPIGFWQRRIVLAHPVTVKVYPSFKEMKKFEMMAISNRLSEAGIRKIRKVGHHMEFDQVRDYIKGDDYRTINWKASARKGVLMVNQYQEEKAQQIISVIDMGRTMQNRINGMTLLDYAINTTLVISDIVILKHDKAGVITFNTKINALVPPANEKVHMNRVMEALYKIDTTFSESSYEQLYFTVSQKITRRSLLMIYTNFDSPATIKRELPVLTALAKKHLVVVVIFKDYELEQFATQQASNVEDIYIKTMAGKITNDKYLIAGYLESKGIHTIITSPDNLTVDSLNKYLELKSRGLI